MQRRSHRLTAAGEAGLPQVILPGALDMVNFGPPATRWSDSHGRKFASHTPNATLMRTTPEENVEMADFIARRLNAATGPVAVSAAAAQLVYDARGEPFFDPEADAAFRTSLITRLAPGVGYAGRPPERPRNRRHGNRAAAGHDGRCCRQAGIVTARANRTTVLRRLRAQIEVGRSILAVGAGNGLVARCAEQAKTVAVVSTSYCRLHGHPSMVGNLPVGDANQIMLELGARGVIPATRALPVIGGVYRRSHARLRPAVRRDGPGGDSPASSTSPTVGHIETMASMAATWRRQGWGSGARSR